MKKCIIIALSIIISAGSIRATTLLEKKIFFTPADSGKADSCSYWKIFLGTYPATFPQSSGGEDSVMVTTDLNLTLFSSGFIEGTGYSGEGKITCVADFLIDSAGVAHKVPLDSIDFVAASGGARVKLRGRPLCPLFLDVYGNRITPNKKLTLTKYDLVGEDRNLRPAGDIVISSFAFSRAELLKARKAEKDTTDQ